MPAAVSLRATVRVRHRRRPCVRRVEIRIVAEPLTTAIRAVDKTVLRAARVIVPKVDSIVPRVARVIVPKVDSTVPRVARAIVPKADSTVLRVARAIVPMADTAIAPMADTAIALMAAGIMAMAVIIPALVRCVLTCIPGITDITSVIPCLSSTDSIVPCPLPDGVIAQAVLCSVPSSVSRSERQ